MRKIKRKAQTSARRLQAELDANRGIHAPLWNWSAISHVLAACFLRAPTLQAGGWPPNAGGSVSTLVIEWVPLKPEFGVSCFWRLLIFAEWLRRTPFGGAENPPITFICELKKQVRRSFALLGEGQSAISDRAGDAHGISNPKATEHGFRLCQQRRPEAFREHAPSLTGAWSEKASFAGGIASLLSIWRLRVEIYRCCEESA